MKVAWQITFEEIRKMLRREAKGCRVYQNTSGVRAWCKVHGVNQARASEFLNGKRLPTTDILNALGLEWTVVKKRSRIASSSND